MFHRIRRPLLALLPALLVLSACVNWKNVRNIDISDGRWAVRVVNDTEETLDVRVEASFNDEGGRFPWAWTVLEPGEQHTAIIWPLIATVETDFYLLINPSGSLQQMEAWTSFEIEPIRLHLMSRDNAIEDMGVYHLTSEEGRFALRADRRSNAKPAVPLEFSCSVEAPKGSDG